MKISSIIHRSLFAIVLCSVGANGCSHESQSIKRVEVDVQTKTQSEARGLLGKPTPVYSTSFAIRLAELALKERGVVDCDKRSVAISFCDGVYSVTFEKPEDSVFSKDYVVDINADTSRIIRVDTGKSD